MRIHKPLLVVPTRNLLGVGLSKWFTTRGLSHRSWVMNPCPSKYPPETVLENTLQRSARGRCHPRRSWSAVLNRVGEEYSLDGIFPDLPKALD